VSGAKIYSKERFNIRMTRPTCRWFVEENRGNIGRERVVKTVERPHCRRLSSSKIVAACTFALG